MILEYALGIATGLLIAAFLEQISLRKICKMINDATEQIK